MRSAGEPRIQRCQRGAALVLAVIGWFALSGATPASAAGGLTYYGGPVAHSMNVILVEWGSSVRSTYTDSTSGDPGFFSYLASQNGTTTDLGGVLAQYMDTSGANSQNAFHYGGMVQIGPSVGATPPATVQDSDIQTELQNDIEHGVLPSPGANGLSTMYVVLFPPNDDVCDAGSCAYSSRGFCAYHGSFPLSASTHVLYGAMVDNGPGTPNNGLCGPSANDVANQTDVVSHEFSEAINDPLVAEATANAPPLAWYDPAKNGGEIGDICVGAGEQALNGPWTVQRIWSNLDSGCVASESAYTAPTASFLAPSSGAAGQVLSFDASSSSDPSGDRTFPMSYSGIPHSVGSGIAAYRWDWGDGSPASTGPSASAAHAYAAPGNYNVSLAVTDDLGFTSTVTREVSVTGAPPPPVAPTRAPSATTGAATNVTSSSATVAGIVNANGSFTTYHVEYGTNGSYGHSTVASPAGSGSLNMLVSVALSGLRPKMTYHYRLVATSAVGASVGADRTLSTLRALAPAPRFSYHVLGRPSVAAALAHGLKVRFSCSRACLSQFTVMLVPRGGNLQFISTLVTVGRGQRRIRSRGSSIATVRFLAKARRRLAAQRSLKLLVSGYASSPASTAGTPSTSLIKLTG